MLDDVGVICESHGFPIYWLSEVEGVIGLAEAVDDDSYFFEFFFSEFGVAVEFE